MTILHAMAELGFRIRLKDTPHNISDDSVFLPLICCEIRSLQYFTLICMTEHSKNMCPHAYRDHQQKKTPKEASSDEGNVFASNLNG